MATTWGWPGWSGSRPRECAPARAGHGQRRRAGPYAQGHHRHARPIYQGTNAIVRLYTDARPVPRLLRRLVLQGARRLPPLQAAIVGQLTGQPPQWMRALALRP
ncbi:MAG: hypothetical protein U1E74_06305 [Paenacidovorax caeni]